VEVEVSERSETALYSLACLATSAASSAVTRNQPELRPRQPVEGEVHCASVTNALFVAAMSDAICKHCQSRFSAERADARYCSTKCRVAAHRRRRSVVAMPPAEWLGEPPILSRVSRSFNADGAPALSNEELGEKLVEIADNEDGGQPKTGRRYYYLALSHGFVMPSMAADEEGKKTRAAAQKRVTDVLGKLRMAGLLAWDMVLDLTRELTQWQAYASPREARAAARRGYDEDRWLGQRYFPVLVVEKDTMVPISEPIASQWRMPFASSRGYSSLKLQHDVANLIRRREAETGQTAVILFISDLDPSGLFDLQRAWKQAMEKFGAVALFVRIGLNRDQVDALDNPVLRRGIDVKPSDSRAKQYIVQYGDRCWETDILPAAVIEAAIGAEINRWLDAEKWRERSAEIEAARKLI
jgi:hypothetical protein